MKFCTGAAVAWLVLHPLLTTTQGLPLDKRLQQVNRRRQSLQERRQHRLLLSDTPPLKSNNVANEYSTTTSRHTANLDFMQHVRGRRTQEATCDFCGDTGACGRTKPLGDSFSVSVTQGANATNLVATCQTPEWDKADCVYSPNNVANPIVIPESQTLLEAYGNCTADVADDEGCCTFVYPRYIDNAAPEWLADDECTFSTCRMMERYCLTVSTTFTCPTGTTMVIFGWAETTFAADTDRDGGVLVGSSDGCTKGSRNMRCDASPDEFSWIVVAAADDCSCMECEDGEPTGFGSCNVPVTSPWTREGFCSTVDQQEFCTAQEATSTPTAAPQSQTQAPTQSGGTSSSLTKSSDDSSSNTGIIAGIVAGIAVLVVGGAIAMYCACRKPKGDNYNDNQSHTTKPPVSVVGGATASVTSGGYPSYPQQPPGGYGYPPPHSPNPYGEYPGGRVPPPQQPPAHLYMPQQAHSPYVPQQGPPPPQPYRHEPQVPPSPPPMAAAVVAQSTVFVPDHTEDPTDASQEEDSSPQQASPPVEASATTTTTKKKKKKKKKAKKSSSDTSEETEEPAAKPAVKDSYYVDL